MPAAWPTCPSGCSTIPGRPRAGAAPTAAAARCGAAHEVGGFVSNRAHHKHSELIANSEIFGLNRHETLLVSQIARYHRRSVPRSSHLSYMALPRESRIIVSKLAALLRVADALIRGHRRQAADIRFQRDGDDLLVTMPGGLGLLLEERAVEVKSDLLEDIYGVKNPPGQGTVGYDLSAWQGGRTIH